MEGFISWLGAVAATMANPQNAGLYLGLVSCVLLALVAGLLLTIGEQMRRMKADFRKAPLLAEDLARQLMQAREAMAQLQKAAREAGPALQPVLKEAGRLRQDLEFLNTRAEKLAQRLEQESRGGAPEAVVTLPPAAPRVGPLLAAYSAAAEETTQVEVQNVQAAATTADERQPDLLEELLHTLHAAPVASLVREGEGGQTSDNRPRKGTAGKGAGVLEVPGEEPVTRRAKARRTVSQAELDLREKLGQ